MGNTIVICPKCACQLEVLVQFASGPVNSKAKEESPAFEGQERELAPRSTASARPAIRNDDIGEMLDQINDGALTDWERDFVGQVRDRFEQYGQRTLLSDKQRAALKKIAEK